MSQGGGDPKWVAMRMGPWTTGALIRVGDNRDHHKHLGYMGIRGIALALICFYCCVWLAGAAEPGPAERAETPPV